MVSPWRLMTIALGLWLVATVAAATTEPSAIMVAVLTASPVLRERLGPMARTWIRDAPFPVTIVTDGGSTRADLDFLLGFLPPERHQAVSMRLCTHCSSEVSGVPCKTMCAVHHLNNERLRLGEAAPQWFVRVMDDTLVIPSVLVAELEMAGSAGTSSVNMARPSVLGDMVQVFLDMQLAFAYPNGGCGWAMNPLALELAVAHADDYLASIESPSGAVAGYPKYSDDVFFGELMGRLGVDMHTSPAWTQRPVDVVGGVVSCEEDLPPEMEWCEKIAYVTGHVNEADVSSMAECRPWMRVPAAVHMGLEAHLLQNGPTDWFFQQIELVYPLFAREPDHLRLLVTQAPHYHRVCYRYTARKESVDAIRAARWGGRWSEGFDSSPSGLAALAARHPSIRMPTVLHYSKVLATPPEVVLRRHVSFPVTLYEESLHYVSLCETEGAQACSEADWATRDVSVFERCDTLSFLADSVRHAMRLYTRPYMFPLRVSVRAGSDAEWAAAGASGSAPLSVRLTLTHGREESLSSSARKGSPGSDSAAVELGLNPVFRLYLGDDLPLRAKLFCYHISRTFFALANEGSIPQFRATAWDVGAFLDTCSQQLSQQVLPLLPTEYLDFCTAPFGENAFGPVPGFGSGTSSGGDDVGLSVSFLADVGLSWLGKELANYNVPMSA